MNTDRPGHASPPKRPPKPPKAVAYDNCPPAASHTCGECDRIPPAATEETHTMSPSAEKGAPERLTESEWRQRDAQRECIAYGHDWQIIQTMTRPVALRCERPCGHPGYRVIPPGSTATDTEGDTP